jgi:surface antigen
MMRKLFISVLSIMLVFSAISISYAKHHHHHHDSDEANQNEASTDNAAGPAEKSVSDYVSSGPFGDNCVQYAKSKCEWLRSYSLLTWEQKQHAVNCNSPKKGRVAVIRIPNGEYARYGHVAIVVDVDKEGRKKSITLEETNYPRPGLWKRKCSGDNIDEIENKLNIIGYIKS